MTPAAWLHTATDGSAPRLLHLGGEIDLDSAQLLREQLHSVPDTDDVLIDMSDVRFFGAAGVTLLLDLRERLRRQDHTLRLVAVRHVVHRVLDLLDVLPCRPTISEATAVPAHHLSTDRHFPTSMFPPRQRADAVDATATQPDPLGQRARALHSYIADVATTLGIPASACWCEVADYADAYLALAQRAPAFPELDVALLWDEYNGWSIAIETASGEDLIVLSYLGENLRPEPSAVDAFVQASLTSTPPGQACPAQSRRRNAITELTGRVPARSTASPASASP